MMRFYICIFSLLIVLFSCTTEERTISSISVSEVSKSACKGKSYAKTTRSAVDSEEKTSLIIGTLTNQSSKCTFENIAGNCDLNKIYVAGALQNGTIVICVYKTEKTMADCYCDYDVSFNLGNIEENKYPIKIYVTDGLQKTDTGRLIYEGTVTFSKKTDLIQQIDIPKITL